MTRIKACEGVHQSAELDSDWQKAYEPSNITTRIMPKWVTRSLQSSDKQYMLSRAVGHASDAAAAALFADNEPSVALEYLEVGRGVLAGSLKELRTDILNLTKKITPN
jgi:hypothetical protein